jgi:hypothetical protein
MKKQTAIEWLVNEIPNIDWENSYWRNKIEQAKEMEKQEHSETWDNSLIENKGDNYIGKEKSFEEYYNENF